MRNMTSEYKYNSTILEIHNERRISRSGLEMWNFVRNLYKKETISGQEAMDIMNLYGLLPYDVVFLCSTHGVDVDIKDFCSLLNARPKNTTIQCTEGES